MPKKRLFLFITMCFLTFNYLSLAASHAAENPPASSIKAARQLFVQGNLTSALTMVNDLVEKKPRDSNARFLKGLILARMGQTDESIAVFKALTMDFPEFAEPWNNLAVLYAQEGKLDDAKRALQSAIQTYPDYAVPYENLGDIYLRLAEQSYAKANQLDPKTAVNRLEWARLFLKKINSFDDDGSSSSTPDKKADQKKPSNDKSDNAASSSTTPDKKADQKKSTNDKSDKN